MQLGFFAAQLCSYFFVYFFVVLHKKFNNEWCLEIKEEVTVGALFFVSTRRCDLVGRERGAIMHQFGTRAGDI